jgi:hypothetical protein
MRHWVHEFEHTQTCRSGIVQLYLAKRMSSHAQRPIQTEPDLDSGLVSYLACRKSMTAPQFQKMVNHEIPIEP